MGGGSYSVSSLTGDYDPNIRESRLRSKGIDYESMSINETFQQRSVNNAMNPYNVKIRESRDSDEHPESIAIIIALDVTGSMGSIPHHLIKEGLPTIMGNIIQSGIKHPQVLFLAIGDHECDKSPLQVGQYESSDEMLDKWLTDTFLEGGGGGNNGESYLLSWYFAGYHTSIDCLEKRNQKGILISIGDEPTLLDIPKNVIKNIMGDGQYEDFTSASLLEKANEKYHVYHLHIKQGSNGSRQDVIDGWTQILRDNLIIVDHYKDISKVIPELIIKNVNSKIKNKEQINKITEKKEEIIL